MACVRRYVLKKSCTKNLQWIQDGKGGGRGSIGGLAVVWSSATHTLLRFDTFPNLLIKFLLDLVAEEPSSPMPPSLLTTFSSIFSLFSNTPSPLFRLFYASITREHARQVDAEAQIGISFSYRCSKLRRQRSVEFIKMQIFFFSSSNLLLFFPLGYAIYSVPSLFLLVLHMTRAL